MCKQPVKSAAISNIECFACSYSADYCIVLTASFIVVHIDIAVCCRLN